MKFKWVLVVFLLVSLVQIDAQKRKKDKKKESEAAAVVVEEKVAEEAKPEKNGKKGRTTAATTTTTPAPVIEEEPEEEVLEVVNETRESSNGCPSELKPNKDSNHACTCLDNLEDGAIMVECTALTSAAEMHNIFNVIIYLRENFTDSDRYSFHRHFYWEGGSTPSTSAILPSAHCCQY